MDRTRIDQFLRLIDLLNKHHSKHQSISYGLVPAVIDWTDPDDQVTILPFVGRGSMGAESMSYQNTPASCPNQPLATVDELLLVNGFTPEILYGDNADNSYAQIRPSGLADYLTVYGDGKININTAPELVLRCICETIDPDLARLIIERRRTQPFISLAELAELPGIDAPTLTAVSSTITTQPRDRYYTITATAQVRQIRSTITALVRLNPTAAKVEIILYSEKS